MRFTLPYATRRAIKDCVLRRTFTLPWITRQKVGVPFRQACKGAHASSAQSEYSLAASASVFNPPSAQRSASGGRLHAPQNVVITGMSCPQHFDERVGACRQTHRLRRFMPVIVTVVAVVGVHVVLEII